MIANEPASLEDQVAEVRQRLAELESELASERSSTSRWQPAGFYLDYYATAGFFLGMIAALTSLVLNVVGSSLFDKHPLRIIQVYLTFPLGEDALALDSGLALAVGCCLYIGTGMLLGIVFQVVLGRFAAGPGRVVRRLVIASVLAVAVWLVAFYGILSWLQPLLFDGAWIVELVPWYVGMLTHLVFGWTMALVFPLGMYGSFTPQTESE
ncbi:MAG: hypothetical protein DWQ31_20350 [Planctomycetota bacterium]|nr:MAG: hypothetical protein DWQ31_20350 [Planctomycetota bacterium]REJ96488.1 MAG: hypothetical protein DWQ35_04645 [Planctomycetota bacterium]REK25132.1 MAG: hypothetical protein DWQ42_12235 [Planctomycetota bacterium]REK40524.1 MAG: hypothetical protein DWQ46_16165 [Planctomycetota bacterium]